MRQCLGLLAIIALTPAAGADDVLDGWARFGSAYQRIDMDQGTQRACSALCDGDGRCQSWVFVRAGLEGPDARCELLSTAPTPRRHPGRSTGLSARLVSHIEEAGERPPNAREQQALRAMRPDN